MFFNVSNFLERNSPKSKCKKELIYIKVGTREIKLLIRLLIINQLSLLINLDNYISFVFIII